MMDKDLAKLMHSELMEAAKAIAAKHGYTAKSGRGTYSESSFKISNVEFVLSKAVAAAEGVKTDDEKAFDYAMSIWGFSHVKFGSSFVAPNIGIVSISGYKKANRKYPIIVTDANGKSYKIGIDVIKHHFAR